MDRALAEHHVNPLAVASYMLKSVARAEPVLATKVWELFSDYLESKFLEPDTDYKFMVLSRLEEEIVPKLVKKLSDFSVSDEYVESGALVYTVLKVEQVYGSHLHKELVQLLAEKVRTCIDDYINDVVDIAASPSLSRCLGLSHAFLDELDSERKQIMVESFNRICLDTSADPQSHTYFCTYATFSKSLNTLMHSRTSEIGALVSAVSKLSSRLTNIETAATALLTLGLLRLLTKHTQDPLLENRIAELAYRTLDQVSRSLALYRRLASFRKQFWIKLILALKLNNLEEISYTGKDYVLVQRRVVEQLRDRYQELSKKIRYYLAELLAFTMGISSIFLSYIPTRYHEALLAIGVALTTFSGTLWVIRHRLIEPVIGLVSAIIGSSEDKDE